jgi:hypothetical protein
MYYKLGAGKVAWSKKSKQNGLDHVIDFNQKEEIIGVEVLDMKRALALAASESMLLLAPVRAIAANQT